jgi:hypothetical protein
MSLIRKMAVPFGIAAVALMLFATVAAAQVPPFTVYGTGLKAGDTVEAFDGAKSCGTATADASGNWQMQIASNAACSPAEGDAITFTLNGAATTASETYKAGGAPADVANGVTLTASGAATPTATTPAPASTGNAGFLVGHSTGLASMLALAAFAVIAVGGARAATRRR